MKIGKVVCDKDKEKHEGGKEEEGEDDSKCGDEETEDKENDFRRTRMSWGGNRGRNKEVAILQLTTHCNRQRTPQSPHHSAALLFWIVQSDHHTQCNHCTKSCTMCTCAVHIVHSIFPWGIHGHGYLPVASPSCNRGFYKAHSSWQHISVCYFSLKKYENKICF